MRIKAYQIKLIIIITLSCIGTAVAQESTATRGRRATSANRVEATVTINEQFLNSFLTAVFDNLNEPSMLLTMGGAKSTPDCSSEIRLKRETNGVLTQVHFEDCLIAGQLAFSGDYNARLMGCI